MKTSWNRIKVCKNCLSRNIKGEDRPYCGKCGQTGVQLVLERFDIGFFKVKREYQKYDGWDNPFERLNEQKAQQKKILEVIK